MLLDLLKSFDPQLYLILLRTTENWHSTATKLCLINTKCNFSLNLQQKVAAFNNVFINQLL